MTNKQAFWWAAFGSLLPEVLRFYKIAIAGQALPKLEWPLYVLMVAIFFVVTGFFSVAWGPENKFKAIWVGASAPTLIATLVQSAPTHK
jgi:hypothetical protein